MGVGSGCTTRARPTLLEKLGTAALCAAGPRMPSASVTWPDSPNRVAGPAFFITNPSERNHELLSRWKGCLR